MSFLEKFRHHKIEPVGKEKSNGHVRPGMDYKRSVEHPVRIGVDKETIFKIGDDLENVVKTFPLHEVEIVPDHPNGIKPGLYFETQFTPDEWNSPKTPRWIVSGLIRKTLLTNGLIAEDSIVEGVPEYEKNGKVVIRAEIQSDPEEPRS